MAQLSPEVEGDWEIEATEGIQTVFRSIPGGATGEIKVSRQGLDVTHFAFNARYKDGGDTRIFFRGIKKVHDPLSQTKRWKHYWLND